MNQQPLPTASKDPGDRAVALFRELDGLRTDEPMPAPLGDRAIARAFDGIVAITVLLTCAFLFGLVQVIRAGELKGELIEDPTATDLAIGVASGFAAFVGVEMLQIILWGGTVGKRLQGLYFARAKSYTPVSKGALVIRTFAWSIVVASLFAIPLNPWLGWGTLLALLAILGLAIRDPLHRMPWDRLTGMRVLQGR